MITYIKGKLIEKTPTYAVVETNNIGYSLNISLNTFTKIGDSENCKLYVSQIYVRDDLPKFYGFFDTAEQTLFSKLVSVSGVGGNSAVLMLSSLSSTEIKNGILTGDVALLKSVKGIGEKTAQRIIIDLKNKMGSINDIENMLPNEAPNNILKEEALSALIMLGFNKNSSDKVLNKVIKTQGTGLTVEQLIKHALKNL